MVNACSPLREETFPFFWHPPPPRESPYSSQMLRVSLSLTNLEAEYREERPTTRVVDFDTAERAAVALIPASSAEAPPSSGSKDEIPLSSRGAKKDTLEQPRRFPPRPPCGDRPNFILYGLVVSPPNCQFPILPSDGAANKRESFGNPPPASASRGATGPPLMESTIEFNLVIAVIQDRP